MKKLLLPLFIMILLVIGCENTMNTPTIKVENFFSKYQKMDNIVIKELDYILEKDETMTTKQKEQYKKLLEKQYQNLSYKITKEEIINKQAIVEVEIEVLNYRDAIRLTKEYFLEHPEETNYVDYQLKEMEKVENTIKYSLTLNLEKKEGIWELENITETDRQKIHGLY